MADLATLKARRDALETALASGVTSISVDGQSTTFASPADLRRALRDIQAAIARCTGGAVARPVSATIDLGAGP
jgi:hypothetical protein